ncbi:MAG: PAS domain S-box protein [Hyphomicrobiales bacterium]|nr:PAS domain S-box protein [Hyphomicrobiales bacterium]
MSLPRVREHPDAGGDESAVARGDAGWGGIFVAATRTPPTPVEPVSEPCLSCPVSAVLPESRSRVPEENHQSPGDDAWRLQLLIDSVIDYAIYMIDLDGRVASWNSGAERLKGYRAEEIIGQPFAKFFTPEDQAREFPQEALATAARVGRFESEGWRVRADGRRFWALAVIDAVRDHDGKLVGFAKVTRDITERRLQQNRLLESERRFRHLVHSVVDYAIFQLDKDGIVATWNRGAERIKGYSADEIIGRHFSVFYTEEDRAAGAPARALATAASEGRFEAEGWRVRKDGSRFWASVIMDPIYNDNGELVGFAKVTRDITERMETQRLLRETQEQLAVTQRMEAVGQLSGGIAHDFNNLLMIIIGNLERAGRDAQGLGGSAANLQRAIANATRGAQRAAALTQRLLAFSRRQPLNPKVLDLNKYLPGVAEFLQRALGETIEIEVTGAPGLWPIEVDVPQLETSLVNVAINARDAMPNGGKLTVEAFNQTLDSAYCRGNPDVAPGQYSLLSVSDTGQGMTPDVLARAFEPFFTTKDIGQGTGLGLSQVYGFVKQSGGHVKIYSEAGYGTTVKMYFPRAREHPDAGDDDGAVARGDAGTEIILVVEDDKDLRLYLIEMLRDLNYRVVSAQDAVTALGILEQPSNKIDLMLTDIIMPGMNGRELFRRAREVRPKLKVLFMSGYSRNAVVHQGRVDLDVQLIQKPVSLQDLAARIRDMLDKGG